MTVEDDVAARIAELFGPAEQARATELVAAAPLHDGTDPGARCRRGAVAASRGSLEQLRCYTGLLAVDCRDVIVAGEYELRDGRLARVRDLALPF